MSMKTAGVICEYDPFHNGHKYMLDELRRRGAQRIICLMSGEAVQRGGFASLPAHYRAEAAVECGADAVFELPYPWSSGSAGYFAAAGVYILAALGADTIAFGSESGDIQKLISMAGTVSDGELKVRTAHGPEGTAKSYLCAAGIDGISPNDLLGVEYIRTARKMGLDIGFETVRRVGAGHGAISENVIFSSAAQIRKELFDGIISENVPDVMREKIEKAVAVGDCLVSADRISSAILGWWRLTSTSESGKYAECGGGVAQLLQKSAVNAGSFAEMMSAAATKKYTNARLRRAVLFAMTGVTAEDLHSLPAYVRLLAANEQGRRFLSEIRKSTKIPVVTKPSRIPDFSDAKRQHELSLRLDALATLSRPVPRCQTESVRRSPEIKGK